MCHQFIDLKMWIEKKTHKNCEIYSSRYKCFYKDNFCPRASFHIHFIRKKKWKKKLWFITHIKYVIFIFILSQNYYYFLQIDFRTFTIHKSTLSLAHNRFLFLQSLGFACVYINLDNSVNESIDLNLWHISFVQCYSNHMYKSIAFQFIIHPLEKKKWMRRNYMLNCLLKLFDLVCITRRK